MNLQNRTRLFVDCGVCRASEYVGAMLFGTQEYDVAFSGFAYHVMNELAMAGDPILSKIKREQSPGALGSVFRDKAGNEVEIESQPIGTDIVFDLDDVIDGDAWKLAAVLLKASDSLAEGHKKMFYETMNTVTEATGNVVDAGGRFTFEFFYEALSTIERSLTDDDQLSPIEIVMSPEMVKHLPEQTPEQIKLVQELEQRQLEELLAKRRSRRLS